MPRWKISATDASQGGVTVAGILTDKTDREQALTEGIAELLAQPTFPPEPLQVYRQGVAQYDRNDVLDIMLDKFRLQFWCVEDKDTVVTPQAAPPTGAPVLSQPASVSPTPVINLNGATPAPNRTPRQILRDELARINKELAAAKVQKERFDHYYGGLKARRDECAQLLKAPPKATRHAQS